MPNIAELLIERLVQAGVKRIYGVAGDSLNGITDTIRKRKDIDWVGVRHEEAGAFAAGADAHLTGSLAVCAGSCGPGNMHLINGLYDCFRNRVPVLAIAAHIPSSEIGSGYFQETHPEKLFAECAACCVHLTSPEQMPHILEIAIQTAISLRAVSIVILSGDTSLKEGGPYPTKHLQTSAPKIRPCEENLDQAASLLNRSKKITILGGAGCAGAHSELMRIANALKSPIVHALRGKEYIEYDNPFDVGMTGLIGFASGYQAMMNCDTLLMLGTDFPYRQFYPKEASIIQVDNRPQNIGRRARVDIGLIGDVKETLSALHEKIEEKQDRRFLDATLNHYQSSRQGLDDAAVGKPGKKPIHPQFVAKKISDLAADDAIFSCDVGTPTVWAARYLKMNGKRRLLGSFNHGSMANALPQAIGAQSVYPRRQVISMSGDGGLSMLMGDLLTLVQRKASVKIVVFNNGAYGFVELEMKAAGILEFATDLENPNFAKMAEAIGILGIRVETPEQLDGALQEAFDHKGPALLDVVVNRLELSMPPTLSFEHIVGFNLWMMRAVMNGRGDEVIDLAKTNLLRNF